MTDPVIHPTHSCFDDALEYLEQRVLDHPALVHGDSLLLVHAIVHIPDGQPNAGKRFVHAWIEEDGFVWDCGVLDGQRVYFQVEQSHYYEQMRIERVTKYNCREIWVYNKATRHYGPWDPEYRALVTASQETP